MNNEEKLMVLATIYKDDIVKDYIEELDYGSLSENRMLTMLNTNNYKIRSLFAYNVKRYGIFDKIPENVKNFVTHEEKLTKEEFAKKKEEIKYIADKLAELGTPFVVLKGLGMAETVYRENPHIRDFNDIDILVKAEEADKIYAYFLDVMGYTCAKSSGEQMIYKNFFQHYAPISRNGIYMEMHHSLTQKYDSYMIDINRIFDSADSIDIDGTSISVPNRVDMLISLCYHLYQHEYRETMFMLKPYADIYNLLYCYGDTFEWADFIDYTRKDKLEFPIIYSLYFVNMLYKEVLNVDIIPAWVLDSLMPLDFMERKDAIVSRHLFNDDQVIGIWSKSHTERLFAETRRLRQELCRKYFFYVNELHWKKECDRLDIPFDKNYEFSPRVWEKYGRI